MHSGSSKSLIAILKGVYDTLSRTEKLIADYLIKEAFEATNLTVSELAERVHVSDASVVRFAQKAGYSGFYEMRIALIHAISNGQSPAKVSGKVSMKDVPASIETVRFQTARNIQDTARYLDSSAVQEVAAIINKANLVYFYGAGNSIPVTMDAAYKLTRIGRQAHYFLVPEMAVVSARRLKKGDVAIGISHSGSSRLVCKCLLIAREQHADTVALTNYLKSPLAKMSDHVLLTAAHDNIMPNDSMITRISEYFLVDVLFFLVADIRRASKGLYLIDSENGLSDFQF